MHERARDPLIWMLGFLVAAWVILPAAGLYMHFRLAMAAQNMASMAEMADALHKVREAR